MGTLTGRSFFPMDELLVTENGLMVLVNGMLLAREQVVESLDHSPSWDSYEVDAPRSVTLGDEGVALVYRATAGAR